ncbi:MAG TPA: BatA domain-containing protein [Candidatus Binataceae bacterium]|nr:BatA domain-containing protein [Candidatus Binataceae bacterium]
MGFVYPGALYLFALVPALAVAYLVRERPRRVTVSSVIAFRALRARRGKRFGGWPRPDWMFFVELLILSLAVLAIAEPYVTRAGNPMAVVLDDSAVMQAAATRPDASTSAGNRTRFDAARAALREALERESGEAEVTVYLTAPQPHRLGTPFPSTAAAAAALEALKPSDAPADPAAVTSLLSRLAADRRLRRVLYAGALPLAPPVPARIEAFAVSSPAPNYAIGSFALRREALGRAALHAQLTVANFSPAAQTLEVAISGDGKPVGRAQARLDPGQASAIEFSNLAPAAVYRAELKPADGFMLDNTAWATAGAVKSISILFVTPTPADAAGLDSLPGISVRVASPADFTPTDLARADLAIFEYAVPKEMPPLNALLVMPPPGDAVFDFKIEPSAAVAITGWPPTNPLTDSVNFRLLNLRAGEYFAQHPWLQPVVSGNNGALMLAGERAGHRFVALGFNPFPYLGRQNLPMSVLTLNCLSYLAGFGAEATGYHTGEPWTVPAAVTTIALPDATRVEVTPGTLFTDTSQQGLYQLTASDGAKTMRAVNLADLRESDLENKPALKIEAGGGSGAVAEVAPRREPLTGKFIAAMIALGILEALLAYRRRRSMATV